VKTLIPFFKNTDRGQGLQAMPADGSVATYGRVVDIILTEAHEKYSEYGGQAAINGVFYDPIGSTSDNSQEQITRFAYVDSALFNTVPEVGEIVRLETKPAGKIGFFDTLNRVYYTGIVNMWNNPKNNRFLDVRKSSILNDKLQSELDDNYTPSKVKCYQGDVLIAGRQGQSLRFSTKLLPDDTQTSLPVAVFRLGQSTLNKVPFSLVSELPTSDYSTIYLTSDHLVNLKTTRSFNKSYKEVTAVAVDKYKGEQILFNTGRFAVNAKADDILLSSSKSLGVSADTVNIEAVNYVAITADKAIYLGESALRSAAPEAVLKGSSTVDMLDRLLDTLINVARDLSTATGADGSPIPKLNLRGSISLPVLQSIRRQLYSLKSKKVFTE
jgi:hypothetical protein